MTDQPPLHPDHPDQPGQPDPQMPPAMPPPPPPPPGQPPPFGGRQSPPPGYQYYNPGVPPGAMAATHTDGLAIGALVTGILAIVCFGPIGLVGLGLGYASLNRMKSDPALGGRAMALAGMICGGIGIGFFVLFLAIGGFGGSFTNF